MASTTRRLLGAIAVVVFMLVSINLFDLEGRLGDNTKASSEAQFLMSNILSSSFPSCIDWIAQNTPASFPEESNLVRWTQRVDDSRELTLPETCLLHRFSGAQAQKCLANQHLVMIGDSLTRYQFLDLVYLIEHGHHPPRFGQAMLLQNWDLQRDVHGTMNCTHFEEHGNPTCSDVPHFLVERNYGNWDKYHVDVGGGKNGGEGFFNGRLECQCASTVDHATNTLRYVSSNGMQLTYLKEKGWGAVPIDVSGWKASGCAVNGTCSFSLEHSEKLKKITTRDFSILLEEGLEKNGTIRQYISDVDYVIYNRGVWGPIPSHRAERLFPLMKKWAKKGCYFKSTTAFANFDHEFQMSRGETGIRAIANASGCSNYNAHHLTAEFDPVNKTYQMKQKGWRKKRLNVYWDAYHFQPWVYHELNNALLNMLCTMDDLNTAS